jgi:hypothetical protein
MTPDRESPAASRNESGNGERASLRDAAERAEAKLRAMAREFMSDRFTDRYGDGPAMLALADYLREQLRSRKATP